MRELIDLSKASSNFKPDPKERFALDVLMGLTSTPKSIPPVYFYDKRGSDLFQQITMLDEYYLTRCETEILQSYSVDIARATADVSLNVVELGAGDGHKTRILLKEVEKLQQKVKYYPIDVSPTALRELQGSLSMIFPDVEIQPLLGEYFDGLRWMHQNVPGRHLVLFLGSNIGNFSYPQSLVFLKTLWNDLHDGDLILIGCDLKKDVDILLSAYNDIYGVTDQFNLNLLNRMNRELGANFDLGKFSHYGTYNFKLGAMESYLISNAKQDVFIKHLNRSFSFQPYEPIHCEYSLKYLPEDIEDMAASTGFEVKKMFYDEKRYFADALLQVNKSYETANVY